MNQFESHWSACALAVVSREYGAFGDVLEKAGLAHRLVANDHNLRQPQAGRDIELFQSSHESAISRFLNTVEDILGS